MAIIEVSGLRKQYGEQAVLHDVSFTVEHGEIFGILGPNGAGKTTTVECLVGLREPDGGTVSVFGLDPARDRDELRGAVGVQLQEGQLPELLRVGEALDLYASFYPDPAPWESLLEEWGLAHKRDAAFGKLSGGQKQRLFIALALIGRPRVVVLDELTTGLDPAARRDTWKLVERIRDKGVTVVLVTHFMEEAERLCDRVALIDAGRVVAVDSPDGLVSRIAPEQIVSFRPSVPLDDALLAVLPEVSAVTRRGGQVTVTGTGNLPYAVTSVLARHQIVARDLRIERASLDDAYLALTREAHGGKP
ncbi:ABC transporter ATP-binding protein [Streptosporangium sp. NPDC000396]|uniref:ABC transporter ATP-binding protein n=1 Tax=Streptosporangium sp. NPDC000396 TaxID=3366185 RepID=UPI0036792C41